MSESLRILIFIFVGMLLLNSLIASLQIWESKEKAVPRTSLYLWITTLLVLVVAGLLSVHMGWVTVMGLLPCVGQNILLSRFAHLTMGTPFPLRRYALVALGAVPVTAFLAYLRSPFWIYALPVAISAAYPSIHVFVASIRGGHWPKLLFLSKLFLVITLLAGLHELDFPFLRPDPDAAMFGATLLFVFMHALSILMPMLIHENRQRQYEEELKREVEQKTQMLLSSSKMAALGEMAGGVAHEVNTPLAVITQTVLILKDHLSDDAQPSRDFMSKRLLVIEQTAWRIARIVSGLRTFSRDSGKDPTLPTSIHAIIDETLDLCREKFNTAGVQLKIPTIDAGLMVKCRGVQVSQVLLNLLNNAFDALQALPQKWIELKVSRYPTHAEVTVTDSGPGLPREVREKIFQPFFTTKPVGQGTGLGLSVSSGLIRANGGKLWLNEHGDHTEFVFSLPLA